MNKSVGWHVHIHTMCELAQVTLPKSYDDRGADGIYTPASLNFCHQFVLVLVWIAPRIPEERSRRSGHAPTSVAPLHLRNYLFDQFWSQPCPQPGGALPNFESLCLFHDTQMPLAVEVTEDQQASVLVIHPEKSVSLVQSHFTAGAL